MEIREILKNYFDIENEILYLNTRLTILNERRDKIQEDIKNGNVKLDSSISGIGYDIKSNSSFVSEQERAVDHAFDMLEYKLEKVNTDIFLVENDIFELKCKNSKIKIILDTLADEERNLIVDSIKYKQSYRALSYKYKMSHSNVGRAINKVFDDISNEL